MSPVLQGPRIVVPPPLLFVAGWVAAWLLGRSLAFEIDGRGASSLQVGLGLAFATAGLTLMVWAILTFVHARTSVLPIRPARVIITHGPFRFSRNPMYVGLAAAYGGLALLFNQAWPLVMLPAVLGALFWFVVRREERYLRLAFGPEYEQYFRRVRRWL